MAELLNPHQVEEERLLTVECVTGVATLEHFLRQHFFDAESYMDEMMDSEELAYGSRGAMTVDHARLIAHTLLLGAEYGMPGIYNHLVRHRTARFIGDCFDPRHILATFAYLGHIQAQVIPQKIALLDVLRQMGHEGEELTLQVMGYFQPPKKGFVTLELTATQVIQRYLIEGSSISGRASMSNTLPIYRPRYKTASMARQLPFRSEFAHILDGSDIRRQRNTLVKLLPGVDIASIAQLVDEVYIPQTRQR